MTPKLKASSVNVFRIKHSDLEEFIKSKFGFEDFSFVFATRVTFGQAVEFRVTGLTEEDERRAAELRAGRRSRDVRLILNTLAHDGAIPTGYYIVSVRKPQSARTQYRSLLESGLDPATAPELIALRRSHAKDKDFIRWADAMGAAAKLARAA